MAERGAAIKKLKIPRCPEEGGGGRFEIYTGDEKLVRDYTGLSFSKIDRLNIFEFWLYLRDAVIERYMGTPEGAAYLEKCWRLEQTEPDIAKLRGSG